MFHRPRLVIQPFTIPDFLFRIPLSRVPTFRVLPQPVCDIAISSHHDGFTTIYCLCDRRVANRCFTINILTEFLNSANYRFYKAHEKEGCSKKFHAESFLSYKVVGLQLWWKILHRQFFANNFVKLCKTAIGKLVLRLMPNND